MGGSRRDGQGAGLLPRFLSAVVVNLSYGSGPEKRWQRWLAGGGDVVMFLCSKQAFAGPGPALGSGLPYAERGGVLEAARKEGLKPGHRTLPDSPVSSIAELAFPGQGHPAAKDADWDDTEYMLRSLLQTGTFCLAPAGF
jgi:hypothetical protein